MRFFHNFISCIPSHTCNFIITDVTIGFERNEYPVSEGDGSVTVCINLNNVIERNVTVAVSTQAITAQGKPPFLTSNPFKLIFYFFSHYSSDTVDFSPLSQTIVFAPTLPQLQCVSIFVTSDLTLEENETFFAVLNSTGPDVIINPDIATVTILNDDGNAYTCKESTF